MGPVERVISALCYSMIRERCIEVSQSGVFPHNSVVRFVAEQRRRSPSFLKLPLAVLTLIFDGCGVVRSGSRFHKQGHAVRWKQISAWRESRFGFCRDLMRFYESLTLFAWYSKSPLPSELSSQTAELFQGERIPRPHYRGGPASSALANSSEGAVR